MTPEDCVTRINEVVAMATFVVALITAAGLLSLANIHFASKREKK